MRRFADFRFPAWQVATVSMGALLVAIAVGGLINWSINNRVKTISEQAIALDVQLEDRSVDFRVSVLDVRHFHRNITFSGPSRLGLQDFEASYAQMMAQLDRLEELGIVDSRMPDLDELRQLAEAYYAEFRPAIDIMETDPAAFNLASDEGLFRLSQLENAGRTLDHLGAQRAEAAMRSVEQAADSAQPNLHVDLGLLTLAGAGLAYLTIRTIREQQRGSVELARALQLKNDFIADASHELRTPLTVLRANAELALELDRTWENADMLAEVVDEADRMARLVDDLLFLASSDAGSLPLELELIDVGAFMIQTAGRAETLAISHNKFFSTDLQANAGKYTIDGTPVTLRSFTRGDSVVIEVIDKGAGIPASDLPFLFERFYRVDKSRSRKQGGTGLGLAIARSIIDAHHGHIEAASELGKRTTMRLYLPLVIGN